MRYILYSKENGGYLGIDNAPTSEIAKAKRYERIGDAMRDSDGKYQVFATAS